MPICTLWLWITVATSTLLRWTTNQYQRHFRISTSAPFPYFYAMQLWGNTYRYNVSYGNTQSASAISPQNMCVVDISTGADVLTTGICVVTADPDVLEPTQLSTLQFIAEQLGQRNSLSDKSHAYSWEYSNNWQTDSGNSPVKKLLYRYLCINYTTASSATKQYWHSW